MSNFCTSCGQQILDGARFCAGCGTAAPAQASNPPVAPQQPVPSLSQSPAMPSKGAPIPPQAPPAQSFSAESPSQPISTAGISSRTKYLGLAALIATAAFGLETVSSLMSLIGNIKHDYGTASIVAGVFSLLGSVASAGGFWLLATRLRQPGGLGGNYSALATGFLLLAVSFGLNAAGHISNVVWLGSLGDGVPGGYTAGYVLMALSSVAGVAAWLLLRATAQATDLLGTGRSSARALSLGLSGAGFALSFLLSAISSLVLSSAYSDTGSSALSSSSSTQGVGFFLVAAAAGAGAGLYLWIRSQMDTTGISEPAAKRDGGLAGSFGLAAVGASLVWIASIMAATNADGALRTTGAWFSCLSAAALLGGLCVVTVAFVTSARASAQQS